MTESEKKWSEWLKKSRVEGLSEDQQQQAYTWLNSVRDKVLDRANIKPDDTLIDIGTGTGLLAFGAYERLKNTGKVIASDAFADCVEECQQTAKELGIENEIEFLQTDATAIKLPDASVDVVVMRSVLMHILDKPKTINEFFRILKPNGRISIYESIMSKYTKFCDLINPENFLDFEKLKEIEDKIMSDKNNPVTNFNEESLRKDFEAAGFKNIDIEIIEKSFDDYITKEKIEPWFNFSFSPGQYSAKENFLKYLSEEELNDFMERLKVELDGKTITLKMPLVFIYAEKQ